MNRNNLEMLKRRLDDLTEQEFGMQYFFKRLPTGSFIRCIAGETCLMAGYEPVFPDFVNGCVNTTRYCKRPEDSTLYYCKDVAREVLDLSPEEEKWLILGNFAVWHEDDFEFALSEVTLCQARTALNFLLNEYKGENLNTVMVGYEEGSVKVLV